MSLAGDVYEVHGKNSVSEKHPISASRGRVALFTGIAVALALFAVAAGWALATILDEPEEVLESTPFTFVEVVEDEVGSSINLNTVAEWTPVPVGVTQASGTVTTVNVEPGQEVAAGTVLFTVNLRPVVVAQGDVPGFRPLAPGTTGADVAQLQQFLTALELYTGATDGGFGNATAAAVRAWQRTLGVQATGVVEPGDLIFVPTLPTRVALDTEKIVRGATLAAGDVVVSGLAVSPEFSIPVTEQQAGLLTTGTRVEITSPTGQAWEGFAGEQTADENGLIQVALTGRDGAVICGEACGEITVTEPALLLSRIITVESVAGLTVPSAALVTDASGEVAVIDQSGERRPVQVVTSARGMSVIEGVDAGLRVRVPATEG